MDIKQKSIRNHTKMLPKQNFTTESLNIYFPIIKDINKQKLIFNAFQESFSFYILRKVALI